MTTDRFDGPRWRSRWSAAVVGLLAAGLVGCGSLLDVDNPNNVPGDAIEDPVAANALVNGAEATVSLGINAVTLVAHTAADEMDWVGSRDAWRELTTGKLSNSFNEFTDAAFPDLAEGRWLADEAVKVLEAQEADGTLLDPVELARAYLYASMAYVTIADLFDDWALSDRAEAAAPLGPANMGSLYDTAISRLGRGITIATGVDDDVALALQAMRARANFGRAIWNMVGTQPITYGPGGDGLVDETSQYVQDAVADAIAVLAAAPSPTWKYEFVYNSATGSSDHGAWVNDRQEMRLSDTYVAPDPEDPTWKDEVVLMDPIDTSEPAPIVDAIQKAFRAADQFAPFTVVSAREMRLIIAEAELAAGDLPGFASAINALRGLDGLTDWNMAAPQVPARDLLIYSRKSNLFLQGRRLADHYRFQDPSPDWQPGSQALTSPGTFLPITAIECRANPNIGTEKCSS